MNPEKDYLHLALEAARLAGDRILDIYHSSEYHMEMKDDRSPVTDADHAAHRVISDCLKPSELPVLSEEGREIPFGERIVWEKFWMVDPLDGTKEFIRGNGEFTVNIALIEGGRAGLGVIYAPVLDMVWFTGPGSGPFRCRNSRETWTSAGSVDEFIRHSELLPLEREYDTLRVVASRSHMSPATTKFIRSLKKKGRGIETVSKGSSLKFCLVAEGHADVYPRFGPTWEWDTAAGQAIAEASGCRVYIPGSGERLTYNKENLLNPYFIVERDPAREQ